MHNDNSFSIREMAAAADDLEIIKNAREKAFDLSSSEGIASDIQKSTQLLLKVIESDAAAKVSYSYFDFFLLIISGNKVSHKNSRGRA